MKPADAVAGAAGLHRLGEHAGLFASLAAIPLTWALHWLGGAPLVALAVAAGAAASFWAAPRAAAPMIADRAVGQMLALLPFSAALWLAGVDPAVFPWPGWVLGFLACQGFLFLPPIRRLGRSGPLWDDLAAGALAGLSILGAAALAHGWLG